MCATKAVKGSSHLEQDSATFTRHVSVNGCTSFDRSIYIWIEPYKPQYEQVIELCLSLCPTDFEHTVIDNVMCGHVIA